MTLITIVIAFALELLATVPDRQRADGWFEGWRRRLDRTFFGSAFWNGTGGVVLILAVPLLLVGLLQALLQGVLLGLIGLAFAVLVLTYALRYRPLDEAVDRYSDGLLAGDHDTALRGARAFLALEEGEPVDARTMSEGVLVQANHRLFAVIFWFALLGVVGAVLYRLTWQLARSLPQQYHGPAMGLIGAAQRLLGILDWVPVRLVAAGYALSGSFEDALHAWRAPPATTLDWVEGNYDLLGRTAMGALQPLRYEAPGPANGDDPIMVIAARRLVQRTIVLWAIVIALLTLAGWST